MLLLRNGSFIIEPFLNYLSAQKLITTNMFSLIVEVYRNPYSFKPLEIRQSHYWTLFRTESREERVETYFDQRTTKFRHFLNVICLYSLLFKMSSSMYVNIQFMKLLLTTFGLLLTISLTKFCTTVTPDDDVPKAVKIAFKSKYPKAKKVSWEVDSNDYFEANFKLDDKKYRADFNASGQWIETELSIKFKDLPEKVQAAVKKEYDKDDIVEIEQVDSAAKGKFYDIEIDPKGEKQFDIEYNAAGIIIGRENKKDK